MKLLVSALVGTASVAVLFSLGAASARVSTAPAPHMSALQFCLSGAVELVEERCARDGGCARQSVRLSWSHGEGALFEGDSTGEKLRRTVRGAELTQLVSGLTTLDSMETDQDRWCGGLMCEGAERVLTITSDCSGRAATTTFMGARPVWERARAASEGCRASDVQCVAANAWHVTFATHLANRFGTAFTRLRDAGRLRSP